MMKKMKTHYISFNNILKYFILIILLFPAVAGFSQKTGITLKTDSSSLGEILKEIKKQSGKNILYNNNKIDIYKNESIDIKDVSLEEALKECLKGKKLHYKMVDDVIIIEPDEKDDQTEQGKRIFEQTIRGQVVDLNTGSPLIGANVILSGTNPVKGSVSDINGNFEIKGVPVGRQNIEVSYIGYTNAAINNIYLYAGKEFVITVQLEEKVMQFENVVIKSLHRKDQPLNEMAQVSARSFTVEETERYAGGMGDPSRMAASYAGILTLGTQINDIVIRGNSTTGMLWRMEGLRIPNPNHFGSPSSSGGTTSMLNSNVLSNSDFYTGAFPAEFGDATSGIFDIKLRKGNIEKIEKIAQIGTGGFEFGIEGPVSRENHSSFLADYRYSTFGLMKLAGLNIGIDMVPGFQDMSFNVNIPLKKNGKISVFGIGGANSIEGRKITENGNRLDVTQMSNIMGFSGINHLYFINEKSSISTSIGISSTGSKTLIDNRENNHYKEYIWEKYTESTIELSTEYKNKINSRNFFKVGFDYFNSVILLADSLYNEDYNIFYRKEDAKGNIPLVQSFGEWKNRLNDQLSVVAGIHYQYSKFGNDHSIEPRFSINWDFLPRQSLNLGIGRHSKLQPKIAYHQVVLIDTLNKIYEKPNQNLKMTRSDHIVLGYNYLFNANHRFKIEAYYQYLTNVPIEKDSSYKSLINYGTSFSEYDFKDLVNKGTGYNYGTEVTLEKFLSKGYYYLVTLSLFDSKYRGSDGVLRNTRFNARFILNLVGGYEWFVKDRNTFGLDGRLIWAGGERKIPLNYAESARTGKAVYIIPEAYNEKFKDYFRIDFKVFYKINKKTSHTLAIDIINIINRQNHFMSQYDKDKNDYEEVSILSILPSILWRWNF